MHCPGVVPAWCRTGRHLCPACMQIISVRHDPQVNEPLVQCEVGVGSALQHQILHTAAHQAMQLGSARHACSQ